MSIILCTGATFVRRNSCLVARIVSFETSGVHLLTFRIVEPKPPKILHLISVSLSHINNVIIVPSNYVNQCFQVSQLLKYDGNVI